MQRPEPTEHAEYYGLYIEQIPDGDICDILNDQLQEVGALLSGIDETKAGHRYGPDKWSIKEVVGHLLDTERAFAFRAMAFARNEQVFNRAFDDRQIRLVFEPAATCLPVEFAICLRARRPNSRAFARVQCSKLDACEIDRCRHRTAKRVNFFCQVPFANAADGRVTAHLA